jgi:anthranilate synthase component 2
LKILVFDNYDSFTYNLVHLVEHILHEQVDVHRNDQIPLEKVKEYDKIILSPGPGIPEEAGLLLPLIKEYASSKSILGVCLGHQAIGEAFGGKLVNLSTVYHGVATRIRVVSRESSVESRESSVVSREAAADSYRDCIRQSDAKSRQPAESNSLLITHHSLFKGLPDEFEAGRYHSWIVSDEGFPDDLEVTALDDNNYIMALRHKSFDVQGLQFHPESVLTPVGETILRNWLKT